MTGYPESKATLDMVADQCMDWNRVLYIGWHPSITGWRADDKGGDWYIRYIQKLREGVPSTHTVAERFKPYFDLLCKHPKTIEYGIQCLNVDIVHWAPVTHARFDLVIWWHGPEHIAQIDLVPTIKALEKIGRCVVLGGPEGPDNYEEPESGDAHNCVLTRELFEELGYKTMSFDRTQRGQGPHISAVKIT